MSNQSERELKARLRAAITAAERAKTAPADITIEQVPAMYREMIRHEADWWSRESPYPSIPHWWWRPFYSDREGLHMEIADRIETTRKFIADRLVEEHSCTRESAHAAVRQLLEAELGGPLYPPEGADAWLRAWVETE